MIMIPTVEQLDRFFSADTPESLADLLSQANAATDAQAKGDLLQQAVTTFPENLDARIAQYKFFFRTAQLDRAEAAIRATLDTAARQGGFDSDYNALTIDTADWLADHAVARLYAFSLKALGVVKLRQGEIEAAKHVLTKLAELDPHDEIGGGNFLGIAQSFEDEDAA